MSRTRSVVAVAALLLAGPAVLTACSDDDSAPDSGATSTPTPTPSESAQGPTGCTAADLELTVRPAEGGGAAGSQYTEIVLVNRGDTACTTGGFGGVSYVDADGNQVGAAATRSEQGEEQELTLAPGEMAVQLLRETHAGNYDDAECDPVAVAGLRVYPPNETHALEAAHPTTGCASRKVRLLEVQPYAPAS